MLPLSNITLHQCNGACSPDSGQVVISCRINRQFVATVNKVAGKLMSMYVERWYYEAMLQFA